MKIVLLVILLLTISLLVDSKKKKKQTNDGDNRKPTGIEPLLYCNSCQAIVREVLKKVKDSTKEYDITDALGDICQHKNFSVYEFPPPDMKKGCEAFMSGWSDEIEQAFIKRGNNSMVEQDICSKITNACQGVEKGARKGNDDYVTINGKKVKMGDDGKVDINMAGDSPPDDDL